MIVLEHRLQAFEDLDGVLNRWLVDVDLLEPAHQGAVLFKVLTVFLVGGRTDAAQHAGLKCRLQQVRRIHGAARGRASADDGVDLVDEQYRAVEIFDFLHHSFQAFFEVAAIARARQQRAHVERKDGRGFENVRHFALDDLAG